MNKKHSHDLRHLKVTADDRYAHLPVEEWVESDDARRPGLVGYAHETSRERRDLAILAAVTAGVLALDVAAIVLTEGLALSGPLTVLAVLLVVLVGTLVRATAGGERAVDLKCAVMEIEGDSAAWKVTTAHRNDPSATRRALEVLAKDEADTTEEAKVLAASVLARLVDAQVALDMEEMAGKEAEEDALREFEAAGAVSPVVDRTDEIDMVQLSTELDLQGK